MKPATLYNLDIRQDVAKSWAYSRHRCFSDTGGFGEFGELLISDLHY